MIILGINAYHGGASACIVVEGNLVAAAEEERFARVKYWAGFPVGAIKYCLDEGGISAYDLDHVAISRDPSANLFNKVLYSLRRRPNFEFIKDRLANALAVQDISSVFCEMLRLDPQRMEAKFHNVEHHLAHMSSAFFVSPFNEAAILSVDGMGDFVSTMWGVGNEEGISITGKIAFPHSLGWFYTALSQWLGFPRYGDEGKVMGLAAYGEPIFAEEMRKILRLQEDGTFKLNSDYFINHAQGSTMLWDDGAPVMGQLFSEKLISLLGEPRAPRSAITKRHEDTAASLQAMLEEAELNLVNKLYEETKMKALCMAGGVALNSCFNGRIITDTGFSDVFIQPAAGDAGTALGAAFYVYNHILGKPRSFTMTDAYTGPSFANGRISPVLENYNLQFDELEDRDLAKKVAQLVSEGKVIGWYQGRMEWGPRALGNRSIIADPRREDMRDILNARIKHREGFRPFAPSILLDHVGDYFDQEYPDPFMLKVYQIHRDRQREIPAVTHIDGTGRLQTVEKDSAPKYWNLISAFQNTTGVPVVLNTSFNENEPIVCTPKEAIDCFVRTKMDGIAIGNFLCLK